MTKFFDVRDAFFTVGLLMLCGGLGAYDWRWALIAAGGLLLGAALLPALRRGGE